MFKNLFILFLLLLLTNCAAPGTALIGPVFTGATTKSVAQASLSAGTNQILRKLHSESKKTRIKIAKVKTEIENFTKNIEPKKLSSFHK
tara:strand:- start:51 stop:317 length:267 start_codon:yes stop_codon:yes gene_type:complete